MRAFVTGSTGLLGSNLVHTLIAEGHTVRALARTPEKAQRVLPTSDRLEVVKGDLEDISAFSSALEGVDVLFNTAAYFSEYFRRGGDEWQPLQRINIDATLALFRAARDRGVSRIIHTSSSGTIGRPAQGNMADETTPPDALSHENLYFRSKVLGDQAIAALVRDEGIPVVTIKPALILGPRDTGPTGFGGFLVDMLAGKVPAVPEGRVTVVDARDVAAGMIRAVERGRVGEQYLIGNCYVTLAQVARILTDFIGRRPYMTMPHAVGMTVGFFSEMAANLTGGEPMVTRRALRAFQYDFRTSTAKAERELGVTYRPLEETLHDQARWFIENGYVPARTA
jgi:dihydroflavonol-4-reductase